MAADAAGAGARIRRRRQALGWTQEQLARKIGVHESSVLAWETGEHYPRRYAGKVEAVLGIRLDSDDEQPGAISDRLRLVIMQELSPEDQRRVIGLLEGTLIIESGAEPHGNGAAAQ